MEESVKSIQSFWRRRNYRKIETAKGDDKRTVTLGDRGKGTSTTMKLVSVKNKVKISPPKSLLVRLRDIYGAMFSWSGDKPLPAATAKAKARKVSNKTSDFDKRMILHIYNTVLMENKPRELPARITS